MRKFFILFSLLLSLWAHSQQDAQYTHYMYNMSVINPGYATSDFNNANAGLLHRRQWMGMDGAPITTSAFFHYAADDFNELGVSFFNDNIGKGVLKESKFSIDYAHILNLDDYHKLGLGIKAGFNMLAINFDGFQLESGDQYSDNLFAKNQTAFYPNIGTGAFFYTKDYYVGLSAPNVLHSKYLKKNDGIYSKSAEEIHFYLTGGYVFELRRSDTKLKPSFMAKTSSIGKISLDLAMNAMFNENLEFGLAYRINSSVNGLVNFSITENLRIGYSYDYSTNNLTKYNSGSHELMLLYNFNLYGTNAKSPRFF